MPNNLELRYTEEHDSAGLDDVPPPKYTDLLNAIPESPMKYEERMCFHGAILRTMAKAY